jgi:hypothetical protein
LANALQEAQDALPFDSAAPPTPGKPKRRKIDPTASHEVQALHALWKTETGKTGWGLTAARAREWTEVLSGAGCLDRAECAVRGFVAARRDWAERDGGDSNALQHLEPRYILRKLDEYADAGTQMVAAQTAQASGPCVGSFDFNRELEKRFLFWLNEITDAKLETADDMYLAKFDPALRPIGIKHVGGMTVPIFSHNDGTFMFSSDATYGARMVAKEFNERWPNDEVKTYMKSHVSVYEKSLREDYDEQVDRNKKQVLYDLEHANDPTEDEVFGLTPWKTRISAMEAA